MRIKILLSIIFLLVSVPFTSSADELQVGQSIQWKPIPGSAGYIVEIMDSNGNQIEKKSIATSELEINLPEGNYQFRIIALNKFKKVGRIYPWKDLIIKPVDSPVVTSSPSEFDTSSNTTSFIAKGKFLHRGTRVELEGSDRTSFPADVSVLPDGSGIKVTPPANIPQGKYSVRYKNSKGKPFVNTLAVVEKDNTLMDRSITETKKSEKDKIADRLKEDQIDNQTDKDTKGLDERGTSPLEFSMWSLFWRQALIPGWGHYHAGYEKTGAFYFVGSVLLVGAAAHTNQVYNSRRKSYQSQGENFNFLISQPNIDMNLSLYSQINLQSEFNSAQNARLQAGNSLAALGGFYLINLIHILITGSQQSTTAHSLILDSSPEIMLDQMGTKYRAGVQFEF